MARRRSEYFDLVGFLDEQVVAHHQAWDQWQSIRKNDGRWVLKSSKRSVLLNKERFGRILAEIGGWRLGTGKAASRRFAHSAADQYRDKRTGHPPWEAKRFRPETKRALLRCIALTYGFLAPSRETFDACQRLCALDGTQFVPESILFEIREGSSASRYLAVNVFDVLALCPFPIARMEYCRAGSVSGPVMLWMGPRTLLLPFIRAGLETIYRCDLTLWCIRDDDVSLRHHMALASKETDGVIVSNRAGLKITDTAINAIWRHRRGHNSLFVDDAIDDLRINDWVSKVGIFVRREMAKVSCVADGGDREALTDALARASLAVQGEVAAARRYAWRHGKAFATGAGPDQIQVASKTDVQKVLETYPAGTWATAKEPPIAVAEALVASPNPEPIGGGPPETEEETKASRRFGAALVDILEQRSAKRAAR